MKVYILYLASNDSFDLVAAYDSKEKAEARIPNLRKEEKWKSAAEWMDADIWETELL